MAEVKLYKSYRFKNKDPVIDEVKTLVQDSKKSYETISNDSGVAAGTLHNWFGGATRRPQHATIMAVVRTLGYDYKLVRSNTKSK